MRNYQSAARKEISCLYQQQNILVFLVFPACPTPELFVAVVVAFFFVFFWQVTLASLAARLNDTQEVTRVMTYTALAAETEVIENLREVLDGLQVCTEGGTGEPKKPLVRKMCLLPPVESRS